ncbi:MAG TPA: LptF/LptG family permease [Sulfuricurvum sp.]|nr:LptF/LptG family permease [Sulfuricurvum sp.]
MGKLNHYIFSHLNVLFFSIFIPLFTIASVIFMIKIATLTAVITLNGTEMLKLYLFSLPELLFYTLPIAFFVAAALTFFRLSNDNEMVVVFSLGITPRYLARVLMLPAFLLTILLLMDYLLVTPYIKNISKTFKEAKKSEARFNLTASEFGHSFGDWMLFINKSDAQSRTYGGVVLFNKEMKEEVLITSNTAELQNNNGALQLKLNNGEGYTYDNETFKHMKFKTLKINDKINRNELVFNGIVDYWTNAKEAEYKKKLLITNTLLSLFPILSIFLIIALGVVHARHQKRWIYLWLFVAIVSFYATTMLIQKWLGFWTVPAVAVVWLLVSYLFYRRLVGNRF